MNKDSWDSLNKLEKTRVKKHLNFVEEILALKREKIHDGLRYNIYIRAIYIYRGEICHTRLKVDARGRPRK